MKTQKYPDRSLSHGVRFFFALFDFGLLMQPKLKKVKTREKRTGLGPAEKILAQPSVPRQPDPHQLIVRRQVQGFSIVAKGTIGGGLTGINPAQHSALGAKNPHTSRTRCE